MSSRARVAPDDDPGGRDPVRVAWAPLLCPTGSRRTADAAGLVLAPRATPIGPLRPADVGKLTLGGADVPEAYFMR